jgi:hypothetical protein
MFFHDDTITVLSLIGHRVFINNYYAKEQFCQRKTQKARKRLKNKGVTVGSEPTLCF